MALSGASTPTKYLSLTKLNIKAIMKFVFLFNAIILKQIKSN